MNFKLLTPATGPDLQYTNDLIADFLYQHLDQYGDARESIMKCIDYALSNESGRGGCVLLGIIEDKVAGVVVINHTGMSGYIPENILVYIAVDKSYRGQGIGGKLMEYVKKVTMGDIALHVEHNNPAKRLYERSGFTNPYLEMRWKRP
ncbi:GNAT family N-acetyltransferase [bacterium]|nr:GNAT family N-acetyltransferase [bacterium]